MTDVIERPPARQDDESREEAPQRAAATSYRWPARVGVPVLFAVLVLGGWQAWVSLADVPAYLVPGPFDILVALRDGAPDLVEPTLVTMQEAYGGFALAAVTGFAAALLMARWKFLELGGYPYLVILQTIPIIAVAPIFVVWFGAGVATNTLVAAMIAVFPVAANTLTGLKSTDRNLVQLYRMAGAPPRVQIFSLRVPHALPEIMTGLKIAASSAAIGAIVGEFAAGVGGGKGGLGYAITRSANQLQTAELFACVVLASLVALLLFAVVTFVEWLLLHRWHESATPEEE
ncbi:ABC transporter permease [uncultured Aeromicrobium sp.]|uniref:ABC transporter permease n=1 Tax=uncultured Aeromicrobium sp. TaxID=337820 RepID=UPI0025F1B5EA|nr:ABC transporter permease [uncultured Aeromicrobium sp.]